MKWSNGFCLRCNGGFVVFNGAVLTYKVHYIQCTGCLVKMLFHRGVHCLCERGNKM